MTKEWEQINQQTYRMWIPEGWLIKEYSLEHIQMIIVNDPTHEWDTIGATYAERKIAYYTNKNKE